ncbi:MAG: calcium-binding protein [Tateyamaria sp.]
MDPVSLLALLTGLVALGAADAGDAGPDDDDPVAAPVTTDTADAPVGAEPEDTGASFIQTDDGVEIELGEDETGSLAAIIYVDSEDDPDNFYQTYEARFYLVPKGADLSDQEYEERSDIPGQQDFGGDPFSYELSDFETHFDLELLGTVPLDLPTDGNPLPDPSTMRDVLPDISANADVAVHYLEATTDGDELITFLNDDYIVTRNGVTEQVVTEDTTGTAGADWLTTGAEGLLLDGGDGNDILIADHGATTLSGGNGDDTIEGVFAERDSGFSSIDGTEPAVVIDGGAGDDVVRTSNATVDAGAGDDTVTLFGGEARGGDGDDQIAAQGDGVATLFGDPGSDRLSVGGIGSQAFGGLGDDFVSVDTGAVGYGDAGNDSLQLESGSAGIGGDGNDIFTVWNQFRDDAGPATVTGGAGADTIDARVWNALNGEADDIYLTVTDFDPAEDALMVGVFQTSGVEVDSVDVVEASDGSYTDVQVTFSNDRGVDPAIATIRLDGATGVTADQIVIMA